MERNEKTAGNVTDMEINSFEDLDAWKLARELRKKISLVVKKFPKEETYSLVDQMKRASRSATANIAEGHGRFHYQDNIRFCRQSKGSLYELIDHSITAHDEGFISDAEFEETKALVLRTIKTLNGYIRYLNRRKKEE